VRARKRREGKGMEIGNETVKVGKDGTVHVDGVAVGRVVKTTEGTSIYSALSGQPGPVRWVPEDMEGGAWTSDLRTRKEAVNVVVDCSRPRAVSDMELDTRWDAPCWTAMVNIEGIHLGVSQLLGETCWYVYYQHDRGAFCPSLSTLPSVRPLRTLADKACIELLDRALAEARRAEV
jgi:hypothetical protein